MCLLVRGGNEANKENGDLNSLKHLGPCEVTLNGPLHSLPPASPLIIETFVRSFKVGMF